jgi:hypothetical protein
MNFKTYIETIKLTDSTKKTYSSTYRNYLSTFENTSGIIPKEKIPIIIEYIHSLQKSNNTKMLVLATLMNLMLFNGYDMTEVKKIQQSMFQQKTKDTVVRKATKKDLPTKKELLVYLKSLLQKDLYREYIINYLLINFTVRNQDLNLQMVLKKTDAIGKKNYIVVRASSILYIRRDYKTFDRYGEKMYIIRSPSLTTAAQELISRGEDMLLPNTSNLTQEIKKYTYKGLSESDYMKIIVSDIDLNKNYRKLDEIGRKRGTSVPVIISEYNLKVN